MNSPTHTLRKTRRAAVVVSADRTGKWTPKDRAAARAQAKSAASETHARRSEPRYESYCTDWYMPEETGPEHVADPLG